MQQWKTGTKERALRNARGTVYSPSEEPRISELGSSFPAEDRLAPWWMLDSCFRTAMHSTATRAIRRCLEFPCLTDHAVTCSLLLAAAPCDAAQSRDLDIAAARQRKGGADMGKMDHVLLLAATVRTLLSCEEAALAEVKDATHPADLEAGPLCFDEAEVNRLPAFARKAAFCTVSRSCFRTAFSRRKGKRRPPLTNDLGSPSGRASSRPAEAVRRPS